ncbi:MAG: prolipoprotein diacylglyceryl transferase [Clostridia bacterium]|nr:prolipoprotein diacylglyceryl transferase [Clostridia bacterium]
MFPEFTVFGKTLYVYPLISVLGFFAAGLYFLYRTKKAGQDENTMIVLLLWSGLGVLMGGHMMYGFTQAKTFWYLITHLSEIKSFRDFLDAAVLVFGGSVFYGGLIGGMLVGRYYCKKKELSWAVVTENIAPAIPLFSVFGRIGCFLGGCCYGVQCKVGFTYTHSMAPDANGVVRFPIQLVEAGLNAIIFLVLNRLLKKGKFKGSLLAIYIASYAVARFVIEFFRGDVYRGFLLGLSTSQWISIGLLVACGGYLIWKCTKKPAV